MLYPPDAVGDRLAAFAVALLFQGKFFVLFSFVFGWGFAIQIASAERARRNFGSEYLRRLAGLAAFGVAHALLVFIGDILVLYSLLGLALLALRNATAQSLLRISAGLLGLAFISLCVLAIVLSEPLPFDTTAPGYLGTFGDAVRQRSLEWPYGLGFILLFNGPTALAAFCVGLAAAKTGFFERGAAAYAALKRQWPRLLVLGLIVNCGYALAVDGILGEGLLALFAFAGVAIGGPCLAAVYLLSIVELSRRGALTGVTPAGRMSLTAYIAEGMLAGLLFNGYGFGQYGQYGALACLSIAIGIYAIVHVLCAAYLRWQSRGPLEALLRLITRGVASQGVHQ